MLSVGHTDTKSVAKSSQPQVLGGWKKQLIEIAIILQGHFNNFANCARLFVYFNLFESNIFMRGMYKTWGWGSQRLS